MDTCVCGCGCVCVRIQCVPPCVPDNSYACDPRIASHLEEEKQKKLAVKQAKRDAARARAEEEERVNTRGEYPIFFSGHNTGHVCNLVSLMMEHLIRPGYIAKTGDWVSHIEITHCWHDKTSEAGLLWKDIFYCTALRCAALRCAALRCAALRCTALCYTI